MLVAGVFLGIGVGLILFLVLPGAQISGSSVHPSPGTKTTQPLAIAPVEGAIAPDFALPTPGGDEVNLYNLRGKVVLLNFWATWCGPCRLEMPSLQDRFDLLSDQGFTVLGINFDEPEGLVAQYGEDLGLTFPLLLDKGGRIQEVYRIRGYPTSIFVDREGMIKILHIGIMSESQLDEYLAEMGLVG